MYSYIIQKQVEDLKEAGVIKDTEAARKVLDKYWKDKIAAVWTTEDVISRAEENGKMITEEQAVEVLQTVLHKFDATQGINWYTLDCYMEDIEMEDLPEE